jgi:UDP-N-acetyl-D-mannosaminuronate dehydrogenase
MKNSPAFENFKTLSSRFQIKAYDPYVDSNELDLKICKEQIKSLENSDVLIIFNESKAYQNLSISEILSLMRSDIIIDPFGVLDSSQPHSNQYFTLRTDKYFNEL